MLLLLSYPAEIQASEEETLSENRIPKDIISIVLPTVDENEESPFDFFIDPQGLIYETQAALYGGGEVEEGAFLLFHNRDEGEYLFSRHSDRLQVTNQGDMPVIVTVSAAITDIGEISLSDDKDFGDSKERSIYLAIVDDEGNERPITDDGTASVSTELHGTYSFGLTGECNPNGEWKDVSVRPVVTVTWQAEPVTSGESEEADSEEEDNGTDGGDEDVDDLGEVSENGLNTVQEITEEINAEEQQIEEQQTEEAGDEPYHETEPETGEAITEQSEDDEDDV